MGGKSAHEFMVMSEVGEDTITYCDTCDYAANVEYSKLSVGDRCPSCDQGKILVAKGIEVGNIFKLGTKYSESMNAKFTNDQGKEQPIIMGCYGLGVSRTFMAIIEQNSVGDVLVLPKSVSPFEVHMISIARRFRDSGFTDEIYNSLSQKYNVLFDDRDLSSGIKFKDSDLIGIPILLILSQKEDNYTLEVIDRLQGKSSFVQINNLESFIESLMS
jgi:prolyl-tRNA synthetase